TRRGDDRRDLAVLVDRDDQSPLADARAGEPPREVPAAPEDDGLYGRARLDAVAVSFLPREVRVEGSRAQIVRRLVAHRSRALPSSPATSTLTAQVPSSTTSCPLPCQKPRSNSSGLTTNPLCREPTWKNSVSTFA